MGNIQRRPERGGKYRARWINPETGREQTKMFRLKEDARRHLAAVEGSKLQGAYVTPSKIVAVSEPLGHDNATLVLKTYGHLMPDSEDRMRRAVESAWSKDDDAKNPNSGPQPPTAGPPGPLARAFPCR
jgi:hypothetical protein